MLTFPLTSPIAATFQVPNFISGGVLEIAIAWYGLLFALGVLICYRYCYWQHKRSSWLTDIQFEQFTLYAMIGAVVGGKIGYALLYTGIFQPELLLNSLLSRQGMSFHGGFLGCIFGLYLFSRKHQFSFIQVTDFIAPAIPWGLMMGRLGNFVNSELWGRTTNVAWGMVFPNGGHIPRHPSQLYEMFLEGLVLGIICHVIAQKNPSRCVNSAVFLIGYATFRIAVEFFREPDSFVGLLFHGYFSFGQLLCLPMLILGIYLLRNRSLAN